ncbi:MAG: response regulator [Planctomycetota bacterium]|nr:response regulator [Planctomycetota bacterium]
MTDSNTAKQILVVDDSPIIRKYIRRALSVCGVQDDQVLDAENGKVALSMLSEHDIGLVILDLNMPVMDGPSFLLYLRMHEEFNTIPVAIVSTECNVLKRSVLERLGIAGYLRKPFAPNELKSLIDEQMEAAA